MATYLGDFPTGETIYIPFNTFDSNDPAESCTVTGLATTDIEVYKDGGTTQRSSDAGYALLDTDGIDFDGITGIHGISVDTSDNTDAGFYAAGSDYWVVVSSITVDGGVVSFIAAIFSIDNRGLLRPATATRTLVVDAAGLADANMVKAGPTGSGTAQTANDIGGDVNTILLDTGTDGVVVASIAANAITATAINADAITSAKIADNAIGADQIAANAIGASEIADAAIDAATFAANAITSTVVADNTITAAKINADAITSAKIADNALANEHFAAGALTSTEITSAAGCAVASIAANAVDASAIADNAIDAGAIAANAITSTEIADGAITAAKLGADCITAAKIGDDAIAAEHIASGAIVAATFGANAITSTVVADNTITAAKINADAITNAKIADDAIGAENLATDALSADALAAGAVTEIQSGLATASNVTDAHSTTDGLITTVDGVADAIKVVTDNLAASATTLVTGTVSWDNTNASRTIFYSSDITTAAADHYNGRIVIFTSGALQNQATDITDYALVSSEGQFTVTELTGEPADNVTFVIV